MASAPRWSASCHGCQPLGHVHPSDTYWYLQAAPELLELVGQRLDAEIDTVIELCGDPRLAFMSQATIAAWGHRPQ